ncbi:M1 family metallopeptidase [Cytophagales bacterium LB-30]|uniref:Aminopeptidase N n=1 Tax=Shiella aurantiaca TaxID=3058365 RepID=A0ABT8F8Z6_9BACT|nr:M1 family metallopeptidase [Shiella aurantiaca]MDN4166724.1 M1 family metallopeptidase [Shiella aurantiaca]
MKNFVRWRSLSSALLLPLSLGLWTACSSPSSPETVKNTPMKDLHTYAKPEEVKMKHLALDLAVDFSSKTLSGSATIYFDKSDFASLWLDTKALEIRKISGADGSERSFKLHPAQEHLGQALEIALQDGDTSVRIEYVTSPEAEALQWLAPVQTAGKEQPFLFTQSQAILARSWIPLQDSPGIRFTYEAKITVPAQLMALMSAENPTEKSADGVYRFAMPQPIPAYLMALSVGDVAFASVGARTGVYAEPSELERCAYELGEMEQMLNAAEALYGPYQWGRYDVIVLPPSFPFGGMENPRLTFATPTIIAGDRSLTSLIAHELAHSWSGNLVTNATWNDFWLNEGFTVYFENRIMEAVYGKEYAEMLASLSLKDLQEEVAAMTAAGQAGDTRLKLDLKGRNPDDGVTSIAYDKGYFFLRLLEERVGRDKFDVFLKEYFTTHAFSVMDTEGFIAYLNTHLLEKNGVAVDTTLYAQWIYGEGLPSNHPQPSAARFEQVDTERSAWEQGKAATSLNTKAWSTHEWVYFLRTLPETLSLEQMQELDQAFGFTQSGNAEIVTVWFTQAVKLGYEAAYPAMEAFLVKTGRRKFLMPIYSQMAATEQGMRMAKAIYAKARPNYHFVSSNSLDKLLGVTAQ